jgi:hypothetical protein
MSESEPELESNSNFNLSVSFNTTLDIIKDTTVETITELKETVLKEIEQPLIQTLMTGADEVSLPTFKDEKKDVSDITSLENLFEPVVKPCVEPVIKFKTDLKALVPIVNVNPEPNSFLIKLEQLVEYIKSTLGDTKLTATNIIIITTNLMHIVEQYKDLTGSQKKMLILDTLKKVITQNVNDPQERISLMMIVDMTLPQVLDTLVTAINGGLKFEKDSVFFKFKNLFCCGGSKTN